VPSWKSETEESKRVTIAGSYSEDDGVTVGGRRCSGTGHESERPAFDEAEAHGEIVFATCRCDRQGRRFLLRIAEKTGANRLSNGLVPGVPRRA